MKKIYPAIRVTQTKSEKRLTLFSANSYEISSWSGVPQKKKFGTGEETVGFQREENEKRLESLAEFYSNEENIIQNPLLCSTRNSPISKVTFSPESTTDSIEFGKLTIEVPEYSAMSFCEILGCVRDYLESRVPDLANESPNEGLISKLKARASEAGIIDQEDRDDDEEDQEESGDDGGEAAGALFEESHIVDFWQEVACRHEILNSYEGDFDSDNFLGFTKESLITYLQPVVLVDGQHRLKGALRAAQKSLDSEALRKEIEERVVEGEDEDEIRRDLVHREARPLPISLLMSENASEQVFQFVVVNQKATPIGKALLGTIVSTTLSNEEMEDVASRLKAAGIELQESQAITFLARYPESPFFNLIQRGLAGDSGGLLQWNVFSSLISIFKELKGGKLFGQKNDYADIWRSRHLNGSKVCSEYAKYGYDSPYEYWGSLDGPWREIFMKFFSLIRDKFGSTEDPQKHNYWGNPRSSNLFNKISLTILSADFFQFLNETKSTIDDVNDISEQVDSWLEYVSTGYFDKDWNLAGIKKDSVGIRSKWAEIWSEYRKSGGSLPDKRLFRVAKSD